VTSDPDFNIALLLDAEYLRNDTRYRRGSRYIVTMEY